MSNSVIEILQEAILRRKREIVPKIDSIRDSGEQHTHKMQARDAMERAVKQVLQATADLNNTSSATRDDTDAIRLSTNGPYSQSKDLEHIVNTIKQIHDLPKHDKKLENLLIQYAQEYAGEVNKNITEQRAQADDNEKLNGALNFAEKRVAKAVNEIPTPPQRVKLLTRFPPFGRSGGGHRR